MADFATVADLETFMGVSGLGTRGTAMLHDASAQIRLHTGQDIDAVAGRQEAYAADSWRFVLEVTQVPVTALTVTENLIAVTDITWTRWGNVWKNDGTAWDGGPILITYDSGYASTEDEFIAVASICKEVAARAIGGNPETFGLESQELRGPTPAIFLTDEEKHVLDRFGKMAVA